MSIQKFNREVLDGVVFYVSEDRKERGISKTGLSILCGVSDWNIRNLLMALSNDPIARAKTAFSTPENLQHLLTEPDLTLVGNTQSGAIIIKSNICADIIEHYAYHAKHKSKTAVVSYKKFTQIGIDTWIDSIVKPVDAEPKNASSNIAGILGDILNKLTDMEVRLEKTAGYRIATATMPGLQQWMESIALDNDQHLLEAAPELFTLNEWAEIEMNGMILSRSNKHALSLLVSSVYKAMSLELPQKVVRINPKTGYNAPPVQAYPRNHFPLIRLCFTQLVCK